MSDKVRDAHQLNQLKQKYGGVGDSNTTRREFFTTIHRDTLASIIGHEPILQYNSVIMNQHPEVTRQQLLRKFIDPIQSKE
jgi:splicing factor 3B subunit 5